MAEKQGEVPAKAGKIEAGHVRLIEPLKWL